MSLIIYSILFGVVGCELVHSGIRWYRAAHYLDITQDEAWHELRRIYGNAARERAGEIALIVVFRTAFNGTYKPDPETILTPNS